MGGNRVRDVIRALEGLNGHGPGGPVAFRLTTPPRGPVVVSWVEGPTVGRVLSDLSEERSGVDCTFALRRAYRGGDGVPRVGTAAVLRETSAATLGGASDLTSAAAVGRMSRDVDDSPDGNGWVTVGCPPPDPDPREPLWRILGFGGEVSAGGAHPPEAGSWGDAVAAGVVARLGDVLCPMDWDFSPSRWAGDRERGWRGAFGLNMSVHVGRDGSGGWAARMVHPTSRDVRVDYRGETPEDALAGLVRGVNLRATLRRMVDLLAPSEPTLEALPLPGVLRRLLTPASLDPSHVPSWRMIGEERWVAPFLLLNVSVGRSEVEEGRWVAGTDAWHPDVVASHGDTPGQALSRFKARLLCTLRPLERALSGEVRVTTPQRAERPAWHHDTVCDRLTGKEPRDGTFRVRTVGRIVEVSWVGDPTMEDAFDDLRGVGCGLVLRHARRGSSKVKGRAGRPFIDVTALLRGDAPAGTGSDHVRRMLLDSGAVLGLGRWEGDDEAAPREWEDLDEEWGDPDAPKRLRRRRDALWRDLGFPLGSGRWVPR